MVIRVKFNDYDCLVTNEKGMPAKSAHSIMGMPSQRKK